MANLSFSASTNGESEPGKLMGILSIIGAFLLPPAGLVLGIIGLKQSKAVKKQNTLALAGTIISGVTMLIGVILMIITIASFNSISDKAKNLQDEWIDNATSQQQQLINSAQEQQ